MSIPVFIVEEHHEAFLVWAHLLKGKKLLQGAALLHFDDHSDFKPPVFQSSVNHLLELPLPRIRDFVYDQMKIDTFILPAIYLGIFNEFVWVKDGMNQPGASRMLVRSFNNEGKKIIAGKATPKLEQEGSLAVFNCIKMDTTTFPGYALSTERHYALDIDLDYFSCCVNPVIENEIVIAITREEYEEFINNKYHYLNLVFGSVKAVQKGDHYFYVLNAYQEKYPSEREVDETTIENRIRLFISHLEKQQLQPALVTICRSRFSGFTPRHQWAFIEERLLHALSGLYDMKIRLIDELCGQISPGQEGLKKLVNE